MHLLFVDLTTVETRITKDNRHKRNNRQSQI